MKRMSLGVLALALCLAACRPNPPEMTLNDDGEWAVIAQSAPLTEEKEPEKPVEKESATVEEYVYVTPNGTKYHRAGCAYAKDAKRIAKEQAMEEGYEPCKVCEP